MQVGPGDDAENSFGHRQSGLLWATSITGIYGAAIMTWDSARRSLVILGVAASLQNHPCLADTLANEPAAAEGIQEIVVTATRRAERLQDVPISITAFSQEKLDGLGLKNIDDLSRLTPGVTFSRNGMGSSANYNDENSDISIRGIDSSAGSSTTGIYLDDTPVQSRHIGFGAVNVFPQLFDIDRVGVLRGPQGTLFGAGAEGGAVRFITPAARLAAEQRVFALRVASTKNGDPSYELGAAAGGPIISDVLGFRVSASYRRDGGWVDRVAYTRSANDLLTLPVYAATTESAANWQETVTARAALKWQATSTLSVEALVLLPATPNS